MWPAIKKKQSEKHERKGQDSGHWLGVTSNRMGRLKSFGMMGPFKSQKPPVSLLVANPDSSIRDTLRSFLGMLTIIICK